MYIFFDILSISWDIFTEVSVYMLFGFLMAGVLFVLFKAGMVSKYLGRGKIKPVIMSATVGIPIPLCSCGVVPAAAGLRKQGANKGSSLSFLISTPESGIDSIAVTYAMLDPIMTVARPVAAFFTAITAGIIENYFGKEENDKEVNPVQGCSDGSSCCFIKERETETTETEPLLLRLKSGLKYAFCDLIGDIGRSFIVGILIAGIITYLLPNDFSKYISGNNFLSMLVMLVAGIPMYVCATSSTPIVAALILKGLNPGAALVFLLAGPATNIATMSMITELFNKRTLFIYLSSIAVCSIIMGILVDFIYSAFGLNITATAGKAAELFPHSLELVSSFLLAGLLIYNIGKRFFSSR